MGLTIVYSNIAQQDLKGIYNYIRRDSVRYARNEVQLIRIAIRKLKSNSLLGKKFEKSDDELTRELIFRNYRIVYDIILDKQIIILSIHHHARSITNNPAFTDED
ncbi:type II toxin-antitoxin system RelE/ParE family toxin [Mucilaginibacter sp.]|uniref:type II toxin-antitoxin system RelE/ParE family toxin n=1 Tax=Mucilaginibacter sp. TaxID=1882438 RepID=UPI002614DD2E|nr:type II toxin-antitoxin system RelE/ParE family toxin [Mucilaginibacter sp.]MDB4925183.1 type toxin-antitoxin system RelE/ParE family toxin [Mucilaginibacter sp.]